jgi:hypothetical protein
MTAPRPLVVALIALAAPAAVRADFPDHEYMDKVSIRLRTLGLNPFPVYSRTTGQGVVGINDKMLYVAGDARIFMPRGYKKKVYEPAPDGTPFTWVKAEGWQSNLRFAPKKDMTFVNVGPSEVRVETMVLRRGDYATYDGSKFVRGTFRAPDRVRVEPEDTSRELAAELLTEARVRLALNQSAEARKTLERLIRTYPDTKSAADAGKLLPGGTRRKGATGRSRAGRRPTWARGQTRTGGPGSRSRPTCWPWAGCGRP